MHIANFALARCMRNCVGFLDVADEVYRRGSTMERSTSTVAEGFVPSPLWQDRFYEFEDSLPLPPPRLPASSHVISRNRAMRA